MTLTIELIVWHHKRRTSRQPYSAAAYLVDPGKGPSGLVVGAGECPEASNEAEAAREALRDLQERREAYQGADVLLVQALLDPVAAITERRVVG